MSERIRLRNRHASITQKMLLAVAGADFDFYVDVGFDVVGEHARKPLEIFLRPRGPVKEGSLLNYAAHGAAESLSLLLQHGHTPKALHDRYKPGSLERAGVRGLLVISIHEGLELDPESLKLADEIAAARPDLLKGNAPAQPTRDELLRAHVIDAFKAEGLWQA